MYCIQYRIHTRNPSTQLLLLNFTHPITDSQRAQIESLAGRAVEQMIERMPHFDDGQPLAEQVRALVDGLGLTGVEWQSEALLVNPPGLAPAAVCLMAELHGRTGYFPATIRIRPVADAVPRQYEVAEILELQGVRDAARRQRVETQER